MLSQRRQKTAAREATVSATLFRSVMLSSYNLPPFILCRWMVQHLPVAENHDVGLGFL